MLEVYKANAIAIARLRFLLVQEIVKGMKNIN